MAVLGRVEVCQPAAARHDGTLNATLMRMRSTSPTPRLNLTQILDLAHIREVLDVDMSKHMSKHMSEHVSKYMAAQMSLNTKHTPIDIAHSHFFYAHA